MRLVWHADAVLPGLGEGVSEALVAAQSRKTLRPDVHLEAAVAGRGNTRDNRESVRLMKRTLLQLGIRRGGGLSAVNKQNSVPAADLM